MRSSLNCFYSFSFREFLFSQSQKIFIVWSSNFVIVITCFHYKSIGDRVLIVYEIAHWLEIIGLTILHFFFFSFILFFAFLFRFCCCCHISLGNASLYEGLKKKFHKYRNHPTSNLFRTQLFQLKTTGFKCKLKLLADFHIEIMKLNILPFLKFKKIFCRAIGGKFK